MATPTDTLIHAASALLFDQAGWVLLVRQTYGHHLYSLPGGLLEPGETPQQAAVREALEEVGVVVSVRHLVGMYHLQGGGRPDSLIFAFACRLVTGEPAPADPDEIGEVGWFDPGRLPEPISNDAPVSVADAVAGGRGIVRTVQRRAGPG